MVESSGQTITMVNPDLSSIPLYPLAADLELHWYETGDEAAWLAIHKLADRYTSLTDHLFAEQFLDEPLSLEERQFYLQDRTGRFVATTTAWASNTGQYAGFGQVHWVAVIPEYQNRGIGKMLMRIVCQRLMALGHYKAFLKTSTLRPAAIHLYETFGFRIVPESSQ